MPRLYAWTERHLLLAGFAVFAVVSALVRVADYAKPLASDTGQFVYVGDTVGMGGMPYADAAYNKGPLTALLFAVVDPLAGSSASVVRASVLPFTALAALALAGYVAHHSTRAVGFLAGLVFAALSAVEGFEGAEARTEQFGVAPVMGALWLATRGGTPAAAGSGALVACAALLNPTLVVAALPVAAELWLDSPRGERARRFAAAALGALAPAAAAAVWLVAGGALGDAVTQMGDQLRDSVDDDAPAAAPVEGGRGVAGPRADSGGGDVLPELRSNLPASGLWVAAFVSCAVAARDPRLRRAVAVLALSLVTVLLRVKLPEYEFDYQYYPALPAIAGVLALAIATFWGSRSLDRIAVAAVVLAFPLWSQVIRPQKQLLRLDPAARMGPVGRGLPVADFLRDHTQPDERILVAGGRAEIYWHARRRAPTRFFDAFGPTGTEDLEERNRDLARNPPAAVAVARPVRLTADPGIERFIRERGYALVYESPAGRVWFGPP